MLQMKYIKKNPCNLNDYREFGGDEWARTIDLMRVKIRMEIQLMLWDTFWPRLVWTRFLFEALCFVVPSAFFRFWVS